ncbi:flagellar export protein FliJ [Buchnera aphidicola (Melanaphis sacchari)]|uniref:Flagellar FliJ protein n=1 Tax=Buchnera aphidicola (Melanaphis sacchari) TaxID=2173854 RepID=A0A2U8DGV5_9GAMM|nr:flagellar FliJ family protein [Buchnera aphidicola]AWH90685.1 flagellar export protein FliJ [Buchnera aphidicola (Melanaphis sacchari)]
MKFKSTLFSLLESVEKKNIEKKVQYINNLYLQKKKSIEQLKLLISYQNEYVAQLKSEFKLGISVNQWKNYNIFISKLRDIISDNKNIIKNYDVMINKNIIEWSRSKMKLNTWNYFIQKNKKKMIRRKFLKENILNHEYAQLKIFKKR